MKLEDRLRSSLARRVADVYSTQDAWSSIEQRVVGRNHSAARVAVAVFALLLSAVSLVGLWTAFQPRAKEDTSVRRGPDRYNLDPRVTARIPIGADARAVAVGAEGTWAISISSAGCTDLSGAASRIDPQTNEVAATVPVSIAPQEVAVGLGSVWVGGYTCRDGMDEDQQVEFEAVVLRLDPESNEITSSIPVGPSSVTGLAVDSTGVWVSVDDSQSGEVVRIDATSNEVAARIPLDWPVHAMVLGEDGIWVWVVDGGDSDEPGLLRIIPQGGVVQPVSAIGVGGAFAVGNGTLWTGGALSDSEPDAADGTETVAVQIDTRTLSVIGEPIRLGNTVFLPFAVGEGGVWYLGGRAEAVIARLNTETLQVDESITVGYHHALSATLDSDSGTIWVADERDGSVIRIDLR
jgi:DNA-binding beta-propeller fold protein YncE